MHRLVLYFPNVTRNPRGSQDITMMGQFISGCSIICISLLLPDEFCDDCGLYKSAARTTRSLLSPTLGYILAWISFYFVPLFFIYFSVSFLSLKLLVFVKVMGDGIQPVIAGSGSDVATNTEVRNDNDDGGECALDPRYQNGTVDQYNAHYPTAFDAMCSSSNFSDERNMVMFNRRDTRRDTGMGASGRRQNAIKLWYARYLILIGPFCMPSVRHYHELDYLRNLRQVTVTVNDFWRMNNFELVCFKRPYDGLYLVYDAPDW